LMLLLFFAVGQLGSCAMATWPRLTNNLDTSFPQPHPCKKQQTMEANSQNGRPKLEVHCIPGTVSKSRKLTLQSGL
jgi:hypothetical protein